MDIKDIAKSIRTVLKSVFPGTKFSVTISRFSQGSSVNVGWTDGPTKTQLNDLIGSHGTRSQFINTDRTQSIELTSKAVEAWKVQNSEYAHITADCKGEVNCYRIELSGFNPNDNIRLCEDSVNEFVRSASFPTVNFILATAKEVETIPAVEGNSEPEIVNTPETELVEVLAETAPEPQPIDRVSELETELFKVRELLTSTRKLADVLEAEACRLTVQITAANLNQLKNKAEVKQITLTRDEGTIAESGVAVTATGWLEAERTLKQWAKTVGGPTRADKCRILFEFADGESFELLSFNLMQKHRFGVNLAQELLAELQHLAGEVIPAHMTQEDYRNYCKFCKIDPSIYKRLLDRWAIPA